MSNEYKPMPVEPTEEMIHVGCDSYFDCESSAWSAMAGAYKAMLAAAPQPPALGGEPEVIAAVLGRDDHRELHWHLKTFPLKVEVGTQLIDRAHLAPLQAEIERLRETVEDSTQIIMQQGDAVNQLKARRDELEGLLQMFIDNSDDTDVVELCRNALSQPADQQGEPVSQCRYPGGGWVDIREDQKEWASSLPHTELRTLYRHAQPATNTALPNDWRSLADMMQSIGAAYWLAAVKERGPGAVQWLHNEDTGAMFVFTRGEYAEQLKQFVCSLDDPATAKVDENAEFEIWRNDQIESLERMGYPDAAKAFRNLGSVHWAGWQARANLNGENL